MSSISQVEKYSLGFQSEKAEGWARYQGLSPVRLYEERGVSGTRDDRPALALLLDDLRVGDTVVVYSLSRLGRGGVVQLLGIVGQIRERGARLVSLTESVDTESYTGRALLAILATLAELELETTRERTTAGRTQAALQGVWPHNGTSLPLGWARGEDGRAVESEGAAITRRVFALTAGGVPYNEAARALNAEGHRTKYGGQWTSSTVMRIVKTEAYWTGVFPYRQAARPDEPEAWIPIPVPPLVTQEQWQASQRPRTQNHNYRDAASYPLTGHLRCICGAPLVGSKLNPRSEGEATRRYYACRADIRKTPTCPAWPGTKNKNYAHTWVHPAARAALADALRRPEAVAALAQGDAPPPDPHAAERAELTRRREALIDLHLEGLIDRAEFERRRADHSARLLALPPPPVPAPAEITDASLYARMVERANDEEYRELLALWRVRFGVTPGKGVEVLSLSIPRGL